MIASRWSYEMVTTDVRCNASACEGEAPTVVSTMAASFDDDSADVEPASAPTILVEVEARGVPTVLPAPPRLPTVLDTGPRFPLSLHGLVPRSHSWSRRAHPGVRPCVSPTSGAGSSSA